ncbi:MAG: hypothetical protein A2289_22085 [Deltaproteobacteria bacterium RIFOXYA12_FULL_58_15]|nr:MAG: hypothetical protein A2289_22085 [Deltaproteobacteria bacterium RIFOXYA12_FULL_58_15]OGR12289.1 MAG: hypothetical protein A2341_20920 [Deltaproteobacteria bacterium RIFOXYB12_FULL_58_9]
MSHEAKRNYLPQFEGSVCFACGTANPIGLGLRFFVDGDDVCSDVTLGPDHAGWEQFAHGGIISTLLDEVMAYAIVVRVRKFFVTRTMTINYRRPVPLRQPLVARGRVTGCVDDVTWGTASDLLGVDGKVLASAIAEMVVLPPERVPMSPTLRSNMEALFAAAAGLTT